MSHPDLKLFPYTGISIYVICLVVFLGFLLHICSQVRKSVHLKKTLNGMCVLSSLSCNAFVFKQKKNGNNCYNRFVRSDFLIFEYYQETGYSTGILLVLKEFQCWPHKQHLRCEKKIIPSKHFLRRIDMKRKIAYAVFILHHKRSSWWCKSHGIHISMSSCRH